MSERKLWATTQDGNIEFISLTEERWEEVVTLLKKYYFPYENISKAVGFAKQKKVIAQLDNFLKYIAEDGVSVVAVDTKTGKTIGALLNKIQDNNTSLTTQSILARYIRITPSPQFKRMIETLRMFENETQIFNACNVDCSMELFFLVVSPKYSKRGIGLKLCEVSLELATSLYKGENVKTPLYDSPLPLEPRPKLVNALFTNVGTQEIGRQLKFDILKTFSYKDLYNIDNNKSFASIIGNETTFCTTAVKKLE